MADLAQRAVGRFHEALSPSIADGPGAHAVHHVRNRHSAIEVHDDEKAAPASPEADAPIRYEGDRVRKGKAVTDTEADRNAEDKVDAVRLFFEHERAGFRRQQANTAHLSIAREY